MTVNIVCKIVRWEDFYLVNILNKRPGYRESLRTRQMSEAGRR